MEVKAGDVVKVCILNKKYWGVVTNHGMKFSMFNRLQEQLFFVQIFENREVVTVRKEEILEVFVPEEKVEFT